MARSMGLPALMATAAFLAGASVARAADGQVPAGQGANLTVHSNLPLAQPSPTSSGPLRLASGGGNSASGGISAGALQGPLGSPSAASSCRPVVHHVVHRRVVRHLTPPPVVVASVPPPPPPLVAYPVYAYRPVVVPYYRPYWHRYAAWGYRGYGPFYRARW